MRIHHAPYLALVLVVLFFGLLLWWDSPALYTQTVPTLPYQLTNQHVGMISGAPTGFTELNGVVYFGLASKKRGLWQSDGTAQGTTLVKDIQLLPTSLQRVGDRLYFAVFEDDAMFSLWQSDGTAAGTLPLKRELSLNYGTEFAVIGNTFYFVASDAAHGLELWKSDGTAAGTQLVADLNPGAASSYPQALTVNNDLLYLVSYDEQYRPQLWQSDGTTAGTVLVKDLNPGTASAYLTGLTAMNGQLYFFAQADATINKLWKSDGTADGTTVVADAPINYSDLKPLTAIGNKLYFSGFDDLHGDELWGSDGTTAGTGFIKDLDASHRGPDFIESAQVGNRLYFITAVLHPFGGYEQRKLWMSEGRNTPAILLDDQIAFSQLYALDDQTLLLHRYGGSGLALYRHGGARTAPTLVKEFGNAILSNQIVLQGRLFFHVSTNFTDPSRIYDLWRSDGTASGTIKLVTGTATASAPLPSLVFNGHIIAASGDELWLLDDPPVGPTHFKPQGLQGSIRTMVSTPDALYFVASQPVDIFSEIDTLWRSDGTPQGTRLLTTEPSITAIASLIPVGNSLYLVTYGSNGGSELWYYDGATQLLKQLVALRSPNYYPNFSLTVVANDQLFFIADDGVHGLELWRSNGTPEGTVMLKDIVPPELAKISAAYPGPLFEFGDLLYFGANDGARGQELWRSDGTSAGTTLFQEINPTIGGSAPDNFIGSAGLFFFAANDGRLGRELWQSNGTTSGTRLVADLYPGSPSADPRGRAVFSNTLIFTADNGIDGQQLFDLRTGVPLALPGEQEPLPLAPHHLYLPITKQ